MRRPCKDLAAKEMLREDKETQEQASGTAKSTKKHTLGPSHQGIHWGLGPPEALGSFGHL